MDLIDIDEYKIYAKISTTDQDEKIELISSSVSELVKAYCARAFLDYYDTDKVEYYNGGATSYFTEEMPIMSITSIEESIDYGQNYTALVSFEDYVLDLMNDKIIIFAGDLVNAPNYYKITYKAGFPRLPSDLKLACFDLVDYYMKKESTPRKSGSDVSVQYITNSDLPPHIKRVLDLYRVIR